ncbi:MAG TPA: hypothetical protein PKW08_04990 [Flavobacteriaceae bacterium]|mgnify:CR=1 FL=1|nr:hypothetical protein [Flavobacteriaceae bacterium]MCB9212575.1 hypothetical protein [Alteromonas sp.]HPF10643.1 hypothetical protein [Flavobacteriaceae bacterium]HQU20925.1 hypothetical protein [Flavobacteriaceae bacterium]HQU64409.1 hypothetical protein [Flavobacteriaceae bacterium]
MKKVAHHDLPKKYVLKNHYETDIISVYFYNNIIVTEAAEGVTLSYKTAFPILVTGLKMLGTKPWVYISNRVNSYSLNPNDYFYLEKIPSLKGLAIVSYGDLAQKNAEMESMFFKKPFQCFPDLISAFTWAEELLARH